jgi:hypothetical protein
MRRHSGSKAIIDLAGQRFGTMLVVDQVEKPPTRSFYPIMKWSGGTAATPAGLWW